MTAPEEGGMRDPAELEREIARITTALHQPWLTAFQRRELEGMRSGLVYATTTTTTPPLDLALPLLCVQRVDALTARRRDEPAATAAPARAAEPYISELCQIGDHARCEVATCECASGVHRAHHAGQSRP